MYKEGLARFATVDYSYNFDTLKNRFIHLTNYSINKNNKKTKMSGDFKKSESKTSTKWTFQVLKEYFKANGISNSNIFS